MRQENDPTLKAQFSVDDDERVREISHVQEPWESGEASPVLAAVDYLRRATGVLGVTEAEMGNPLRKLSFTEPRQQGVEYHFGQEKTLFDSSTVIFNQTYLNVPVWRAAVTLTIKHNPNRVLTVTDTSERGIDAPLPSPHKIEEHRRLFALAAADQRLRVLGLEDQSRAAGLAEADEAPKTASFVRRVLGREPAAALLETETEETPDDARAIRGRFFVYRYDAAKRIPPNAHIAAPPGGATEAEQAAASLEVNGRAPSLELPPVDSSIADGAWRLVSEVTFTLTTPELGRLNWRSLVDVETDSVLLLEPLVAGQFGFVFHRDPISSTGVLANGPNQNNAVLNPLRNTVELPNLVSPSGGVQTLRGRFAVVANVEQPNVAPPAVAAGSRFDFDVRTNDFAAVNAYYHTDRFFALVESLGFPIASYFDHTGFPVRVDHRDSVFGNANTINARCEGNGEGGIGFAGYCLNDLSNTANPIGRACDSRVHLHELGGHGVLYEHVDHPNFGFAHSAGDSLSAILHDPDSRLRDNPTQRFRYAPWNPVNDRRFDRAVEQGWAWGGSRDIPFTNADPGGYQSEQILCTTMFRVYRSIGGDSTDLNRRRFASRATIYLILRAISTLTPATNPGNALGFANALMAVDLLDWTTEGVFGGAYNKVIRWAFEKQGLFQAPGTPTPFTKQGRPPAVDVYIDDGRGGEYQFQADHTRNPSVWNRRAADGGTTHQEPAAGVTNFAYVRIRNRGTTQAQNVRVRGFHLRPGGAAVWPTDFQPLTTAELVAGTLAQNNQQEKIVGPFAWVPAADAFGRDRLLMVVSANGDASNVDHFTTGESIPDWRLVPNDNNIGMRSVVPTAGESAQPDSSVAAATASGAGSSTGSTPGGSAGERLLRELGFTGQRLKNVRVKSVTFRVDLDDEDAYEAAPSSDAEVSSARARAASPARASEMAAASSEVRWGIRRHGLIGMAAWERMQSQRAREEILRIFEESGGESSLGEAARWADRIKFDPPNDAATRRFLSEEHGFSTWHYVNLPLDLDGYDRERYPEFTRRNDIVQTILRCVESLSAPGPNARFEEIIALRWLAHLVGDLHQPVHVGCGYIANARTNRARLVFDPDEALGLESDRGGGALLLPDVDDNLHGYWDSRLGPNVVPDALDADSDEELLRALLNTRVIASASAEDATLAARVVGWANESLREAKKAYDTLRIVSYNPTSNGEFYKVAWEGEPAYRVRCAPIVSERMAAAANNLAGLLDTIWPDNA